MDALKDLVPFLNLGVGGIVVLAFIRGWIFSKAQVEALVESYKERLQDQKSQLSDAKAAYAASEARNEALGRQVAQLVELGRTSNAVLSALPGGRKSGGEAA